MQNKRQKPEIFRQMKDFFTDFSSLKHFFKETEVQQDQYDINFFFVTDTGDS